jgi:hypothetical protein
MKYLLLLLLLGACETLPEERPEPEYTEMPIIDTYVDDGVKIAPYNEEERIDTIGAWKYIPVYRTLEIDVSFFTHRRYMVYINVMEN